MKVDNTFDKTELKELLTAAYRIPFRSVTFFPEGEDSYGYTLVSDTGETYFAKASATVSDDTLRAATLLQHRSELTGIVAPLETEAGDVDVPWHDLRVSLFPFIDGKSRWDLWKVGSDFTDAALAQTGTALARIHNSPDTDLSGLLPIATYRLPYREDLDAVLERVIGGEIPTENCYQRRLLDALATHRSQILETLQRYEAFGRSATAANAPFVVTHGDPTPGNLILDPDNRLHIIDWDGIALGPAEKDLVSFTGERFEAVLAPYLAERDTDITLHPDIFGFYIYEWTLNEIRDYSTKILFKNSDTHQNTYDWESLQDYLPPDQEGMAAGIAAIHDTLARYKLLPK